MTAEKVFDALLVLQYRSGDQKALNILVKRHHQRLCKHAYWYIRDIDASKDVVQDCWGIIIAKLKFLKDPNTFGSWAMRIVTRKSLDFLNRKKRKREKLKTVRPDIDDDNTIEEKEIQIKKLKKAMVQLPQDQQIVLRLFYTEAYTLNEIGTILGISVGTVKSRLYHARERLKLFLK